MASEREATAPRPIPEADRHSVGQVVCLSAVSTISLLSSALLAMTVGNETFEQGEGSLVQWRHPPALPASSSDASIDGVDYHGPPPHVADPILQSQTGTDPALFKDSWLLVWPPEAGSQVIQTMKWGTFSKSCGSNYVIPSHCAVGDMLSFLQSSRERLGFLHGQGLRGGLFGWPCKLWGCVGVSSSLC